MTAVDDFNVALKTLHDRIAAEASRAQAHHGAPLQLVRRLHAALECASGVYAFSTATAAASAAESRVVANARNNALIQGHLALGEWQHWLESETRLQSAKMAAANRRRQHARYQTNVPVKLSMFRVLELQRGDRMIVSEEALRPAKNISMGGIFVAVPRDEFPELEKGSIVQLTVQPDAASAVRVRADVRRRDGTGVGLRWIQDSEGTWRALEALLQSVRQAPRGT